MSAVSASLRESIAPSRLRTGDVVRSGLSALSTRKLRTALSALGAQVAAETAFTSLFLGLGAVALLVGGIGIANVMVISVIERRGEIGLRRAIGATRPHISRQFLVEAIILSALGGLVGVGIGSGVTAVYARTQDWQTVVPPSAIVVGLAAAMAIGAIAGLFPAIRAARLSPTEALRRG